MHRCVIRQAGADDIEGLCAIDSFAAPDNARAAEVALWVGAGQVHCAEVDGVLVGYIVLHRLFFGRPMLQLVMVAPGWRRRGIGETLIRHAIDQAGPVLWTSTNLSNQAMQTKLERLGFVRSGIIDGLDPGDPELIYRKTASP